VLDDPAVEVGVERGGPVALADRIEQRGEPETGDRDAHARRRDDQQDRGREPTAFGETGQDAADPAGAEPPPEARSCHHRGITIGASPAGLTIAGPAAS
jgi:hypothetical protein